MNPDCVVSLDGEERGRLSSLQFRVEVSTPQAPHSIGVACPGAAARTVALQPMSPDTVFGIDALPDELPPPAATTAGAGGAGP
jgi:hypothetical protein